LKFNWKMADKSLFAILLRKPWWWSLGIAGIVVLIARAFLPAPYVVLSVFSAMPFIVIAAVAAWKQRGRPSASRVADTLAAVGAMPWERFAAALDEAYRRDGHQVARLPGRAADFELQKGGRKTLVSGKRWKAARTGIEPLRDLQTAAQSREADGSVYITLGEITDNARAFAVQHRIQVLQGDELAMLLRTTQATKKRNR
jgi:restriction system protein